MRRRKAKALVTLKPGEKHCVVCEGDGKCTDCEGRGDMDCHTCGVGTVECEECDGSGECFACQGKGVERVTDADLERAGQLTLPEVA